MASLFTKIINGEIPCSKVYENEWVFAFLDIKPVHLGHTLVIPKKEVNKFYDCDEPYFSEVFSAAKKLSPAIEKATGCKRVTAAILGFEVPHFHLHLIPSDSIAGASFSNASAVSNEELNKMQKKILSFL